MAEIVDTNGINILYCVNFPHKTLFMGKKTLSQLYIIDLWRRLFGLL
jgi:hypothetical protein